MAVKLDFPAICVFFDMGFNMSDPHKRISDSGNL